MQWLVQDLRFGLRSLRKDQVFTLLAVFALALGIGSVTTIFSVIQNVLLDPFPYKDAGRIMSVQIRDTDHEDNGRGGYWVPEISDFQARARTFWMARRLPPTHLSSWAGSAIWATDRNVGLTLIGSLHDSLRRISYAAPRFALILLGVFASVGLSAQTLLGRLKIRMRRVPYSRHKSH